MIFEFDDFGANHIISSQCQSHDCRDRLLQLRGINPKFKVTLFAIPGEMTLELLDWCYENSHWVELAVHGFFHSSNYECEKMTYDEFGAQMIRFSGIIDASFKKIFRAPGWQISTDAMRWLADNNWVIADQGYNDDRRPHMNKFVNHDNVFSANEVVVPTHHGHVWDVGWNGIYEDAEKIDCLVRETVDFKFVSEAF